MRKFNVGDRVVIVKSPAPERIGTVATVVGGPEQPDALIPEWRALGIRYGQDFYILDLPMLRAFSAETGGCVAYPPQFLEPYRPDHNERAEWTEELRKLCGVRVKETAR